MNKKPFFWSIFPAFVFITFASGIMIIIFSVRIYEQDYTDFIYEKMLNEAELVKAYLASNGETNIAGLDSIITKQQSQLSTRITIIDPAGKVLADSKELASSMENHNDRPEVKEALQGKIGKSVRFSSTLQKDLMYVAVPVTIADNKDYIIRTSYPLLKFSDTISKFSKNIVLLAFVVLILLVFISIYLAKRLSAPLTELTEVARQFASGDFSINYGRYRNAETERLALSMNIMAKELEEKISSLTGQKNEQKAILESMVEGVVAIDLNVNIILINDAAAKFFSVDPEYAKGRLLHQVIRNSNIQQFIDDLIVRKGALERTIKMIDLKGKEYTLSFQGTVLNNENGEIRGAVFVMHDITAFKKIEEIRRDFVANVSHELRTPLTSIKGFIETLLDGAAESKEDRDKFLSIINRQVDRLNSIINDLLTLSGLDKDEKPGNLEFLYESSKEILDAVKDLCMSAADAKTIEIILNSACNDKILCNRQLLEQALINLLDNAIKYSGSGTKIELDCTQTDIDHRISVKDHGTGIAEAHIPRLFERFYRVDKARSRKEGGTGLGLSIAKHIVLLHEGRIEVESKIGEGSVFTIVLPKNNNLEK